MSLEIYRTGIFKVWKSDFCNKESYYIGSESSMADYEVADLIGIPIKEYRQILKLFNAELNKNEYFFNSYLDAIRCIKYLEEKYGLIIKLLGKDIGDELC